MATIDRLGHRRASGRPALSGGDDKTHFWKGGAKVTEAHFVLFVLPALLCVAGVYVGVRYRRTAGAITATLLVLAWAVTVPALGVPEEERGDAAAMLISISWLLLVWVWLLAYRPSSLSNK